MWGKKKKQQDPGMGPSPQAPGCTCQICRPERVNDPMDQACIDTVLRAGWQVMLVADGLAGNDAPPDHAHSGDTALAFTVGMGHRADHPEFVMSGLDLAVMHQALNELSGRVLEGRRFSPGDVVEGVLGGASVVMERMVDPALSETLTWSRWFHRRQPQALVVVWPTTSGIFPWQPGAPALLDELQPPNWREPIEHSGEVAADPAWDFPVPADQMVFSCVHVLEEGAPILWVARELDRERGEDWSAHCGAFGHPTDDGRIVHLAHLVRGAPSLRGVSGLGLQHQAEREGPDAPWVMSPLD